MNNNLKVILGGLSLATILVYTMTIYSKNTSKISSASTGNLRFTHTIENSGSKNVKSNFSSFPEKFSNKSDSSFDVADIDKIVAYFAKNSIEPPPGLKISKVLNEQFENEPPSGISAQTQNSLKSLCRAIPYLTQNHIEKGIEC